MKNVRGILILKKILLREPCLYGKRMKGLKIVEKQIQGGIDF
jgi:hypothetical protein